jgi:outer membrane protein
VRKFEGAGSIIRAAGLAVVCAAGVLQAEQPAGGAMGIREAVEAAVRAYPSIRVSAEQATAAAAGIQLARTAYLPRVDGLAQANRATRNNVFGLLLPQPMAVIPSISGPVLGTNNLGTAWGSAVGVLVSWEPFDFGLRKANVLAAGAARARSEAALERTRFEVEVATADAFLTMLAAQETARAAEAAVDRAGALLRTTNALVNAQLRPGADASRAEADLAAARTLLIQAQEATEVARTTVARFTGVEPRQIALRPGTLLSAPPGASTAVMDVSANPVAKEQSAAVNQVEAELRAVEKSYYPRFLLEGAAYARGSGADVTGRNLGGLNGLAPSVQNYALGLTVTFPFLDFASVQAREAQQAAALRAEQARYRQVTTDLQAQWNAAQAALDGARRVAANTPVEVAAARAALDQAGARYQAGLAGIVEVAEAQRLVAQAEIDNALARLNIWRAWLGVEAARGDIQPFLAEAGR